MRFSVSYRRRDKANARARALYTLIAVWVLFGLCGFSIRRAVVQEDTLYAATFPNWLEPRALGIADLVGLVPEAHLRDAILTFTGGAGILQYMEGWREGNTVTARVKVWPRYPDPSGDYTAMNCLGKRALYDEWPIPSQASTVRIFQGGRDITNQAYYVWYYRSGRLLPTRNASDGEGRYKDHEDRTQPATFTQDGSLLLPANNGCTIFMYGRLSDLTAEFRVETTSRVTIQPLGSETFPFRSYVGIGSAGVLDPLQEQLRDRFRERHDKFILSPPEGADYVFVKFPPTPVSPYSGSDLRNIALPSSGTYRLANGDKDLSVDHTASAAIPLYGQWLDADIKKYYGDIVGVDYLMLLPAVDTLSSPEYFVPQGIQFDPCMLDGTCNDKFLDDIFDAGPMEMTIYYYKFEGMTEKLDRIPLRQVGREWQAPPNVTAATADEMNVPVTAVIPPGPDSYVYHFPVLLYEASAATVCPCGLFTEDGRMLDYVPKQ